MTAGLCPGLHEGAARPGLRQVFVGGPGRRAGDQTRRVPEADTSPWLRRWRGVSGPMLPNPAPPRRGARKAEKSARRAAPSPPGALPRRHAIIARRARTTRLPGSRHIAGDAWRPRAPGTGRGGGCCCIRGIGVGACRKTGICSTTINVNSWPMEAWAGPRLGTRLRRSGRSRHGGDSTRSGRYRPTPAVARLAGAATAPSDTRRTLLRRPKAAQRLDRNLGHAADTGDRQRCGVPDRRQPCRARAWGAYRAVATCGRLPLSDRRRRPPLLRSTKRPFDPGSRRRNIAGPSDVPPNGWPHPDQRTHRGTRPRHPLCAGPPPLP